ncbi:DUF6575 domain-containing protein [Oscillibacter sp.]|uniref:DUF6575 domain-containing protein n=1 Tax=Oscillibacter sp. TaxID=1945593 RepID=UPI0028A13FF4|nr:DUF6575 domain-containing protein [Oscillibacter sp.]
MNANQAVFLQAGGGLPKLYMDLILFEGRYPMLFTCTDDGGNLYICSQYNVDGEKHQWVVEKTTSAKVIAMLSDRLTIREAFGEREENVFRVIRYSGNQTPSVQEITFEEASREILPTAGAYMDSDEGEFDEEIWELRKREHTIIF